jgi:hypothetical protein
MADNPELGFHLKEYLIQLLQFWQDEVDYQIRDVWGGYFDRLVLAQDTAKKNMEAALENAEGVQKEADMLFDDAIAVLEVATSFAAAWVFASFKYNVSAKLEKWGLDEAGKPTGSRFTQFFSARVRNMAKDHVAKEMFGEVGKFFYVDLAVYDIKGNTPHLEFTPPDATAMLAHSSSLEELRKNLNKVMRDAADSMVGIIQAYIHGYQNDTELPGRIVERMYQNDPSMATSSDPEKDGQAKIRRLVNNLREQYRNESHYFGYDPPDESQDWKLQRHLEYEMWVLWLLQNKRLFETQLSGTGGSGLTGGFIDYVGPRRVFDREKSWFEAVMDHLDELGLPVENVLTSHGDDRYDAIRWLLNWAEGHVPDSYLAQVNMVGTPRKFEPIEIWTRPIRSKPK